MSVKRRNPLACEDGASAVEFALCVPVFLMMVFGIIQFGWTQHTFSSVRFGMERASRALMINPNLTQTAAQAIEAVGKSRVFLFCDIAPEFYERLGFAALPERFQSRSGAVCMVRTADLDALLAEEGFEPPAYF